MIVKIIKEEEHITFLFSFSKKRKCRISFSENESKLYFFTNIDKDDMVSDNFECHNLKESDYKKIFDYIKKYNKRIIFDLYCKEDVINIKKMLKYGFKKNGENRFEYKGYN